MTKHTIDIQGLPEGLEPVAVRLPDIGDNVLKSHGRVNSWSQLSEEEKRNPQVILLELPKPREITLVETYEDKVSIETQVLVAGDNIITINNSSKIWRVKEES